MQVNRLEHGDAAFPPTRLPNRLFLCMLVFAAVYPLVTGLSYLMQAAVDEWAIWQRHLVVVPVVVVAMVFVIIPSIQKLLVRVGDLHTG